MTYQHCFHLLNLHAHKYHDYKQQCSSVLSDMHDLTYFHFHNSRALSQWRAQKGNNLSIFMRWQVTFSCFDCAAASHYNFFSSYRPVKIKKRILCFTPAPRQGPAHPTAACLKKNVAHLKDLKHIKQLPFSRCELYEESEMYEARFIFNPCPAEPRYTLPLQTVQIRISWLLKKKPTDLDLHCLPLYMKLYQQSGSRNLIGWQLEVYVAS